MYSIINFIFSYPQDSIHIKVFMIYKHDQEKIINLNLIYSVLNENMKARYTEMTYFW